MYENGSFYLSYRRRDHYLFCCLTCFDVRRRICVPLGCLTKTYWINSSEIVFMFTDISCAKTVLKNSIENRFIPSSHEPCIMWSDIPFVSGQRCIHVITGIHVITAKHLIAIRLFSSSNCTAPKKVDLKLN